MRQYGLWISCLILVALYSCQRRIKHDNRMRGVWLTNVASKALYNRSNIEAAVSFCDSIGINHIFVVVWNRATTTYPSQLMENLTGVSIQPEFKGRDPLRELLYAAHLKGIKVHAWFEFGFSCSSQDSTGGPLIKARPHWASHDVHGQLTSKNGFQWMNPFHPEVQNFMTSLVLEVVNNYDIDGIQGDDRFPALPSSGGYDPYTDSLYFSEIGVHPPKDHQNYEWIKWRSNKLNTYLKSLVDTVRLTQPNIIISMAPSIYPWSEQEYLQDWPTWINQGWIDFVVPQVYRYKIDRYAYEMNNIFNNQVTLNQQNKVFPGILLQVDTYNPSVGMLDSMVQINRSHGLNGEVFFFYEGLKKHRKYFLEKYRRN